MLVNKEPGRSHQVEIRIVGREELDLVLNQEQSRIQQDLVRLREKEREAVQKVTAAENKLKKGEPLTPEELDQLLQAEQLQQQIRERVGDRKEGLRAEVERVLDTLKQNGMQSSGARERMKRVERELGRLAENELQQIEPRLTAPASRPSWKRRRGPSGAPTGGQLARLRRRRAAPRSRPPRRRTSGPGGGAGGEVRDPARRPATRSEATGASAPRSCGSGRRLRQQAERDPREAAQTTDQDQPRQDLANAAARGRRKSRRPSTTCSRAWSRAAAAARDQGRDQPPA